MCMMVFNWICNNTSSYTGAVVCCSAFGRCNSSNTRIQRNKLGQFRGCLVWYIVNSIPLLPPRRTFSRVVTICLMAEELCSATDKVGLKHKHRILSAGAILHAIPNAPCPFFNFHSVHPHNEKTLVFSAFTNVKYDGNFFVVQEF